MWQALAIKELREVLGISVICLASYLAFAGGLMDLPLLGWLPLVPRGTYEVPFVGPTFVTGFTCISVLFTIALGFRQSAWEAARGTDQFLLRLPMPRGGVMITKLVTGIGTYLGCSAVPILLYASWAATPGTHASPFQWSMTETTVRAWLIMPLLYLGAFLSGIRPARWFGTRLLPLAAAGLLAGLILGLPVWWTGDLVLLAAFAWALAAAICFVARVRDFS